MAAAMLSLLPSSTALVWVGLMALLVAPGYLLLQAMLGAPRGWHVLAGMGLSIPLIGLLALATAVVPGGFQAGAIVITITLGVLALGALAWLRRSRTAQPTA